MCHGFYRIIIECVDSKTILMGNLSQIWHAPVFDEIIVKNWCDVFISSSRKCIGMFII